MTAILAASLALILVGTTWIAFLVAAPEGANLGGLLARYERRLGSDASFVSLRLDGEGILRLQLVAGACCLAFALVFQQPALFGVCLLAVLFPPIALRHRCRARVARLEQQLDGWLLLLANALRATPSLGDGIASTSTLTPDDFGQEIRLLVKELKLGVPVDRALRSLSQRIGSDIVSSAMMAIVVARRTGGDLSRALEESAASLRETARLEAVLRTKTAEGRGQVLVLAIAPFMLCTVIGWLEPTWFDATVEHPIGRMLLAGCGLLWLVAAVWAYRIVEAPP